ncbi:sterol desaturase-like protein [Tanacetum coccineum]|uniref:Sterol desaturase-like protein n=1 Tax=Tanacetum coccineum TaxID=301880 RepID=A0ABQ5I792_9ASTR
MNSLMGREIAGELAFHSLHHIRFRTNYSLFVPLYDYVYGTLDIDTDSCREDSLQKEESPDVIYLTHLVAPESIYHIRLGFSSLASKPETSSAILKDIDEVVFTGNFNKIAYYLAIALCRRGIKVATSHREDYMKVKSNLELTGDQDKLILSANYSQKTWLVGDGLSKEEQLKALKGTLILPYSPFPPMKMRKECFYYMTAAMLALKCVQNVDSCELSTQSCVLEETEKAAAAANAQLEDDKDL